MTSLRELANEIGVSERTLRRAVNDGTVRATRPSSRKLDLSVAERRYVRRTWPLIARLREALRTESNVRFALLFGSTADGTDTPASDIDLLVGLRDSSLERILDLTTKLTHLTGRAVDLVRFEDAEAHPAFLAGVADHGRVLVDREGVRQSLQRRSPRLRRRALAHQSEELRTALTDLDRFLDAAADGRTRAA